MFIRTVIHNNNIIITIRKYKKNTEKQQENYVDYISVFEHFRYLTKKLRK